MNILIAVLIPVDHQIEVVSILGGHSDELLAGAILITLRIIIYQRQITVRGQSGGAFIDIVHLAVAIGLLRHNDIVLVDIAGPLLHNHLVPVAVFTDNLHVIPCKQVANHIIAHARAGAQIQIAAVGHVNCANGCRLGCIPDLVLVERRVLLDASGNRSCVFHFLRNSESIIIGLRFYFSGARRRLVNSAGFRDTRRILDARLRSIAHGGQIRRHHDTGQNSSRQSLNPHIRYPPP